MTGTETITVDRVVAGGRGLGRMPDGRVAMLDGAVPGDTVLAEVIDRGRFLEGRVIEVVTGSPDRVDAPCPELARGCGGCDWQMIAPATQPDLRAAIVIDALRRLGRVDDAAERVTVGPPLPPSGYRTTIRAAVLDGRAGYRRAESHEVIEPSSCLVAHPLAEELLVDGRFGEAREVRIRVGVASGDRQIVVDADSTVGVVVPDDVEVLTRGDARAGGGAIVRETVAGVEFAISAESFFQCRPDGAEVLVDLVRRGVGDAATDGVLLDAYGGVGLFAATVADARRVVLVESSRSAVADAAVNIGGEPTLIRSTLERLRPMPADVVVADPAREGLGRRAVEKLAATGAGRLVLVSCDPAALGRDTRLLIDAGYTLDRVTTVDLFGHTSHTEAVAVFDR